MSSNVRKQKRRAAVLTTARTAIKVADKVIVKAAQAEQDASSRIDKLSRDLSNAQEEARRLQHKASALAEAEKKITRFEALCRNNKVALSTADGNISRLTANNAELAAGIARRDKEIVSLKSADQDPAKLRRRLQETKTKLTQVQSELNKAKRAANAEF